MMTATQQHLETALGHVEYLDAGSGFPVLYFHGTGAGNEAALMLEQSLLPDCRLIIPNRPGYFGTTPGERGSVRFCADLAAGLLDHLGIGRAAVIGTSGGGMPSAAFARCYPERTAALVLQCAQSHQWDSGRWLPNGLERTLFLFRNRVFGPFLRWQNRRHARAARRNPVSCLRAMSGSRFPELLDDRDVLQQMTDLTEISLACAAAPAGIQNDWAIMVGENGISEGTISCPTLIIHDRVDPLVPFAHAEWSQRCIPQSRLLEIHAGGHLIWYGRDADFMHKQRVEFLRESGIV
jgi:pimeloyl-ACP methyl ester carboxylesterase